MQRRTRRDHPRWPWAAALLLVAGATLVPLPAARPSAAATDGDPRRAIAASEPQREAVLYVMRENLRSVYRMLEAADRGAFAEVQRHATASGDVRGVHKAADAFPVDTPRLWSELGRAADQQLLAVGDAAEPSKRATWRALGTASATCVDCHRRYRLASE